MWQGREDIERTLHEGLEFIGLIQYLAVENNHSSKVGKTLHEGREVAG